MADTKCQRECEAWVRAVWLRERFAQPFVEKILRLRSGGGFKFDAVSADETIVVSISTSRAATSNGEKGVGKFMKLRSDMLFHLLTPARRHVMVFTERCMYEAFMLEKDKGRVPGEIEFMKADLPEDLSARLEASRNRASKEVRARSLEEVSRD